MKNSWKIKRKNLSEMLYNCLMKEKLALQLKIHKILKKITKIILKKIRFLDMLDFQQRNLIVRIMLIIILLAIKSWRCMNKKNLHPIYQALWKRTKILLITILNLIKTIFNYWIILLKMIKRMIFILIMI